MPSVRLSDLCPGFAAASGPRRRAALVMLLALSLALLLGPAAHSFAETPVEEPDAEKAGAAEEPAPASAREPKEAAEGGAQKRPRGWETPQPGAQLIAPDAPAAARRVEEIVVTAQKRAEDIQDVPISITALTSAFIEESGLTNVLDMSQYLPNVQINAVTDARSTAVRIRGIGSDGNNAGIDPSVGVFIDGIFQGRTGAASIVDLADIERIEVLRGPQGTLYGKNTAAGAINVVSKNPVLDQWEGLIEGIAGNYSDKEVRGTINAPLVEEKIALRVSGYWVVHDPFDETLSGGEGRNNGDRNGARVKTLIDITDDLELLVWADYGTEQTTCCAADILTYDGYPNLDVSFRPTPLPLTPTIRLGHLERPDRPLPPANPSDRIVDANEPTTNDVTVWGVANELNYDMGDYVLTWLNGYRQFKSFSVLDGDFTSYDAVFQATDEHFQQASSELRLTSPYGEDLEYVVGAYLYWQEDKTVGMTGISRDWLLASPTVGPIFLGSGDVRGRVVNTDRNTHQTQSYALFGQGTYHFDDQWALTLGLRGTYEIKSRVGSQIAGFTAVDAGPFGPDRFMDESFSVFNLSPMGALQFYPAPDANLFVRVARGFKSGGFNQLRTAGGQNTHFDDEKATDFEAGFRSLWLDGMVTLNATAFYTLYDDFQSQAFDGNSFTVTNAGSLTSYGAETDLLFVPHPIFVFGLGTGYNVAEYDDFPNAPCTAEQAFFERLENGNLAVPTNCTQDLSGRPLDNAPQWTVSSFAQVTYPIGNLPWLEWPTMSFFRAEYSYRDILYLAQDLDTNLLEPPVNLVNLRAGLRTEDESWELTLWVKNLTDATYAVVGFDVPIVSGFAAVNAPPRTFGATLRYRF
jgi:iron complex outermembrane receptor protein